MPKKHLLLTMALAAITLAAGAQKVVHPEDR